MRMLHSGHYVLVEGLDGEELIVRDSNKKDADSLRIYDFTAEEIFKGVADNIYIELVWLEKLEGNEAQTANEFGLKYDQSTGKFSTTDAKGAVTNIKRNSENILQKHGIEVMKDFSENDPVMYSVYLPKIAGQPIVLDGQADNPVMKEAKKAEKNAGQKVEEKKVEQQKKAEEKKAEQHKKVEQRKVKAGNETADSITRIVSRFREEAQDDPSYYNSRSKRAKGCTNIVKYLKSTKGDIEEESYILYQSLMRNTDSADVGTKVRMARQFERIFEAVLEFDMKNLNYGSLDEIINGKLTESLPFIRAISGLPDSVIEDYRAFADDEKIETALTSRQFKEVRAKCDFLKTSLSWVERLMKIGPGLRKYKVNMKSLLANKTFAELANMRHDVHDNGRPGLNKDEQKELEEIYATLAEIRGNWASLEIEGPVKNYSKTYQNFRKSFYGIKVREGDALQKDALNAIRNREAGIKVNEAKERKEFTAKIRERFKEEGKDKDKIHYGIGSQTSRRMIRATEMLKTYKNITEEEGYLFYSGAMVETENATPELKTEKTRQFERIFEVMLQFDMKDLNFNSYEDLMSGKLDKYDSFVNLMFDLSESEFKDYEKLIEADEVETALSNEQLKEVRARWDFVHSGLAGLKVMSGLGPVLKKYKLNMKTLRKKSGVDLANLSMNLRDKSYKGLNEAERQELSKLYQSLSVLWTAWSNVGFSNPGDDFSKLYEDFRKKNYGIENNSLVSDGLKAIHQRQEADSAA